MVTKCAAAIDKHLPIALGNCGERFGPRQAARRKRRRRERREPVSGRRASALCGSRISWRRACHCAAGLLYGRRPVLFDPIRVRLSETSALKTVRSAPVSTRKRTLSQSPSADNASPGRTGRKIWSGHRCQTPSMRIDTLPLFPRDVNREAPIIVRMGRGCPG